MLVCPWAASTCVEQARVWYDGCVAHVFESIPQSQDQCTSLAPHVRKARQGNDEEEAVEVRYPRGGLYPAPAFHPFHTLFILLPCMPRPCLACPRSVTTGSRCRVWCRFSGSVTYLELTIMKLHTPSSEHELPPRRTSCLSPP